MHTHSPVQLVCLVSIIFTASAAADWPQWRGPTGQGIAPEDSKPPTEWSETKNIRWKTELAGRGWSSPVIADGLVWGDSCP